jgi:hypothetical protein
MQQRPVVSQMVIDEFTKLVDSQDVKGLAKYNQSIDEAPDEKYDWKLMALEEGADLQKYLVKRILELEKVIAAAARKSTRFCKYLALESENLSLAKENVELTEKLDTITKAYEALLKSI